jgi:FtsP/CotA-like multicopper oxidase with cupredoxin domain
MPDKLNRREFLYLGGLALGSSALSRLTLLRGAAISAQSRFQSPLRIPRVLAPLRTDETADYYEITQQKSETEILSGLRTQVWGYNGVFPGPTIKSRKGRTAVVKHRLTPICLNLLTQKGSF